MVIHTEDMISWDIDVSLLTNKYIAKQIVFVFSLAILFAITVIFLIEVFSGSITSDFLIALAGIFLLLVAIITVLTILGVFLFMGNRYSYTFTLDPQKGVFEKPQTRQRSKNFIVNSLLVLLGLLAKNPTAAGTGILSQSRQEQFVDWKSVDNIKVDPRNRVITLKKNRRTLMVVFCRPENYETVASIIQGKVS